jgi:hypothetical protein
MTVRDQEVLDALRDEPELLAIADAVAETQRAPRPAHRRLAWRAGSVLAVGAAVLLAVLLWPSGGNRNPILDRALAAIGDGPVLHLVTQVPTGQELVNLQSGRTVVPTFEVESWSDQSLKRVHFLMREDGRVVAELLLPQDQTGDMHFGPVDPSYTALWSGFRKALASGKAKIAGKGTLYGHSVYWLQFGSPDRLVAVDRRTYEPVAFRSISESGRHTDTRVLLFRMEPFSSSAFQRRTSLPNPLAGAAHGSGVQVSPARPSKPARPWLTAGSAIAGVKLSAVHQTQTTSGGKTSNGFELAYGPEGGFRRSLTIAEARRLDDTSEWKGIPNGSMRLSVGEGSDGNGPPYTLWTGYLVRNGVYVTIETAVSRAAVIEAARSLHPA